MTIIANPTMKSHHVPGAALGLVTLLFAGNLHAQLIITQPVGLIPASTIRHDTPDANYTAHAAQAQFAPVGIHSIPGTCSFTAIQTAVDNGQWGLTAAHCLDVTNNGSLADENHVNDTFTIGTEVRTVTPGFAFIHPSYTGDINDGFDIGLVKFNSPFALVTPAQIYTGSSELGATVTSVGFGSTGDGQTGQAGVSKPLSA